jgi:hypothetical protein
MRIHRQLLFGATFLGLGASATAAQDVDLTLPLRL